MFSPIATLAREKAKAFRKAFTETTGELFRDPFSAQLYHPGEYGSYRERLLKNLLTAFMPAYLDLSEGFVIDDDGVRSTQTDVIIYDKNETPKLEEDNLRRFFPTATICGVGEVKSSITVPDLRIALEKLSSIKRMRLKAPSLLIPVRPASRVVNTIMEQQRLQECDPEKHPYEILRSTYDPVQIHWQSLVSFLVCANITMPVAQTFKDVVTGIVKIAVPEHRIAMHHNMLLSLEDGYQSWAHEGKPVVYPRLFDHDLDDYAGTGIRFTPANEECDHIIAFIADLCAAVTDTAIYPFTVYPHLPVEFKYALGA